MSSSTQSNPSYYAMDDVQQETDLSSCWQFPTIIEDIDIMFDGKPLSALYEEDRRRLSAASTSGDDEEEERRGRQRVRQEYSSSKPASKKT